RSSDLLCRAIAFTELMVGPPVSDIVCSSNDDKQVRIIFDETGVMRQLFDPFGKRGTHKNLQAIFNYNTNSKLFRLSDRTSNKEGRNIDGAILDESHEMVDNIRSEERRVGKEWRKRRPAEKAGKERR